MNREAPRTRRPTDAERVFFEDLVVLRRRYVRRDADDASAVASLRHVIAAANATMRRAPAEHVRVARLGLEAN